MNGNVSFAVKGVSGSLSFFEVVLAFSAIILAVVILAIAFSFFCDKANVKSFSFMKGFTFYQDGETKKKRFYHKKAPIAKRRIKK